MRGRLAGERDAHVVICFHDTGPGILPEVQSQLFQPFFTTKQTGTGLGLYVTNRRVRECGGSIACDSGPGRGTCFTVRLPCMNRFPQLRPPIAARIVHGQAPYRDRR